MKHRYYEVIDGEPHCLSHRYDDCASLRRCFDGDDVVDACDAMVSLGDDAASELSLMLFTFLLWRQ